MREFQRFYFEDFRFESYSLKAYFNYSFDGEECFEEVLDFSCEGFSVRNDIDADVIENLCFHIFIALGISYYKLYPTKELVFRNHRLHTDKIQFWEKFYRNGLGEFLITNQIDPE